MWVLKSLLVCKRVGMQNSGYIKFVCFQLCGDLKILSTQNLVVVKNGGQSQFVCSQIF